MCVGGGGGEGTVLDEHRVLSKAMVLKEPLARARVDDVHARQRLAPEPLHHAACCAVGHATLGKAYNRACAEEPSPGADVER